MVADGWGGLGWEIKIKIKIKIKIERGEKEGGGAQGTFYPLTR
jgi:hypothetical protein